MWNAQVNNCNDHAETLLDLSIMAGQGVSLMLVLVEHEAVLGPGMEGGVEQSSIE